MVVYDITNLISLRTSRYWIDEVVFLYHIIILLHCIAITVTMNKV